MARVKTFANGGSLLPGDLNSIEDDYEFAFSTYKNVGPSLVLSNASFAVGNPTNVNSGQMQNGTTYLFSEVPLGGTGMTDATKAWAGLSAFYFDPADWTGNTRVNKMRVRASALQNASGASACTFTVGLYPVTAVAGGIGAVTITLGGVTAGSTVAFANIGASSLNQANSGDFTAPAAGYYVVAAAVTVAAQTNTADLRAQLQMRQV